ncbi:MAG: DUF3352 domain-containing protein [Solirubrobacteraceae bacterium]
MTRRQGLLSRGLSLRAGVARLRVLPKPRRPGPRPPGAEHASSRRAAPKALAAAVAGVLVVLIVVLLLTTGSSEPPPAVGAASVVPGDALAYVHLSTDPSRPAVKRALTLATRFADYPLLRAVIVNRLGALGVRSNAVDFGREIRPWLGKEAALALLSTNASAAGSLVVLDVSDHPRALAYLTARGTRPGGSYAGVALMRYSGGGEAAFVGHYLAIGQDASVRAAIDAAAGRSPALSGNASYQSAAAGEPADRVLDAYASALGVRRVLAGRGGVVGALGVLLDQPALSGTTMSLSAAPGGARMRIHSALDPNLVHLNGAGARAFTPTLQSILPAGSPLVLDVDGLPRIAPRLLQAGAAAGVAGTIGPLLARLGAALSAKGFDVHSLVSIFSGETAVAIAPRSRTATLVLVARTRAEDRVKAQLAGLEAPLAQLFAPPSAGPGQVPEFNDRVAGGITAHQVVLAPGLELDYAVFDGLVVVSTSLDGIAGVANHAHSLRDDPAFSSVVGDTSQQVTSLLFLGLRRLLPIGERIGLLRGARYGALRADLRRISAVGLRSSSGDADATSELSLQIR